MIICGLDPGTGAKSGTGVAIFDTRNNKILYKGVIGSKDKDVNIRIYEIVAEIEAVLEEWGPEIIFVEKFAMGGIGGEMLHKLIGGLIYISSKTSDIVEVMNTTVKRIVAGHGRAEKPEVAAGVLAHFKDNAHTCKVIKRLIVDQEWDILDAFAIAISGMVMLDEKVAGKK